MRFILIIFVFLIGCSSAPRADQSTPSRGQEIVIAGQRVSIGAPVVLWTDQGGYNAYSTEPYFTPARSSSSAIEQGFGSRIPPDHLKAHIAGRGWTSDALAEHIDQIVIHYDVAGTSGRCFQILHDIRGLSAHFLLDVDGTIYQTLDITERAWHATTSNNRSIGIEIANIGAYTPDKAGVLSRWYDADATTGARLVLNAKQQESLRNARGPLFSASKDPIIGNVQGTMLIQYDFTPEQYESLSRLVAALCAELPLIDCDYPRGEDGELIDHKLSDAMLETYQGLIGHFHIQSNKVDPGPAFQWDMVVDRARSYMNSGH